MGQGVLYLVQHSMYMLFILIFQLWSQELPQAVQNGRAVFVPFDFTKDVAVKDCDIYFLRHCL